VLACDMLTGMSVRALGRVNTQGLTLLPNSGRRRGAYLSMHWNTHSRSPRFTGALRGVFSLVLVGNQIAPLVCAEGRAASGLRGYRTFRYARSADCSSVRGLARHSAFMPPDIWSLAAGEGSSIKLRGGAGRTPPRSPGPWRLVLVNPHPRSASCDTSRSPAPVTPAAAGGAAQSAGPSSGAATTAAENGYAASPSGA
jgi:hypothetical protein